MRNSEIKNRAEWGDPAPGVWDVIIVSSRAQLTPILGGSHEDTVDISAFILRPLTHLANRRPSSLKKECAGLVAGQAVLTAE